VIRGGCIEPLVEIEMLRVLLYVTLLMALFVGTAVWGGNAIGAWEAPNVPPHAPDASSTEKTKAKKHKNQKKHQQPAKRDKKR
jgi:hypothetical protein